MIQQMTEEDVPEFEEERDDLDRDADCDEEAVDE